VSASQGKCKTRGIILKGGFPLPGVWLPLDIILLVVKKMFP